MRVLTTVNLKGGSGKTTTAAYLAHAFADRGRRPIVVDADPQGSAVRWQELGGWPLPAVALPSTTLHRQLAGVVDRNRFDLVVIDTPPLEDRHGIVVSSLRVATDVLVTMAPSMMELDRVGPVWKAIEDAAGYRNDDPSVSVLFNRVTARASSTQAHRDILTEQGRRVLATTIPRREVYAQAFGSPIGRDEPHARLAEELLTMWGER
ncbi:ParA family protein [Micromonospora aurantiaca (nom. illeg.)]|uniref:ParA family protein n=1 Tax=Micromonospora aurantiaca (nom. illeg.) TaxID=47850 RepID=UPI000828FF2F|nr:ParA family protein [Micromonospora aurantiaca]SCL21211.1 chromosome partitioning protein [Micromonospora aurantiaca]